MLDLSSIWQHRLPGRSRELLG